MKRRNSVLEAKLRRKEEELVSLRKYKRHTSSVKYKTSLVKKALESSFSEPQLKIIVDKKKKVKKWSEEDIINGLILRSFSRRSYLFLRQRQLIPLPGLSTLRHWVRGFQIQPGVLTSVTKLLKQYIENDKSPLTKISILSFDEMEISRCYEYDQETDQVIGPHKKIQVAMIRGLFKAWKQPLFYSYDTPMKKNLLFWIISRAEETGVQVWGICFDLGNSFLLKDLDISPEKPFFQNPFDKTRVVFVFPDVPHMLKLCRNHVLDDGITIDQDTKITKQDFENILLKDNGELKICYKIKVETHLDCIGSARQRVRPAAQLLSHSTATAMKCLFPDKEKQANWVQTVNDWFDVCNSRLRLDKKKLSCAFGIHYEEQEAALIKMYKATEKMRVGKHKNIIPFQRGILVGIQSLLQMFQTLKNQYSAEYIR